MRSVRFTYFAWGVLGYNLLVILWGAFVRATGSGAGCGSHWPLCNGEVLPREAAIETMIEFAHRISSGFALLAVLAMLVWALRVYPKGHIVRWGASMALFLEITEALVGALLVRFEWVAQDVSMGRVVSISVHLINTFLLVASLALTAWWASGGRPVRWRGQGAVSWMVGLGLAGMLALGVSGAITALGDTLFPVRALKEGTLEVLSPVGNFLVSLRAWHPIIAIVVGFGLMFAGLLLGGLRSDRATKRLSAALLVLFVLQLAAGGVNVLLHVPVWMQIIHLLLADTVWIVFVLLSAAALADHAPADGMSGA